VSPQNLVNTVQQLTAAFGALQATLKQINTAAQQANQGTFGLFRTFQAIATTSAIGGIVGQQAGGVGGAGRAGALVGSAVGIGHGVSAAMASGASAATAAAGAALPIAAVIKEGLSLIADGFKDLVQTAQSYARFAAPGNVERLDRAFEDLYASVGVMLIPIVDQAATILDTFNQAITSAQADVTPVIQELATTFTQLFQAVAPAVGPLLSLVAEMAAVFGDQYLPVVKLLALATALLVQDFKHFAYSLQELIRDLREGNVQSLVTGGWARRALERANQQGSLTIAARPAEMISTEAIGEHARLAAFGSRSISEQQLREQQRTNLLLERILGRPPGSPAGAPQVDWQW
jgi:hypothetical protein